MTIICKPFVFVRHGETPLNRDKLIGGRSDVPLTEDYQEKQPDYGRFARLSQRRAVYPPVMDKTCIFCLSVFIKMWRERAYHPGIKASLFLLIARHSPRGCFLYSDSKPEGEAKGPRWALRITFTPSSPRMDRQTDAH